MAKKAAKVNVLQKKLALEAHRDVSVPTVRFMNVVVSHKNIDKTRKEGMTNGLLGISNEFDFLGAEFALKAIAATEATNVEYLSPPKKAIKNNLSKYGGVLVLSSVKEIDKAASFAAETLNESETLIIFGSGEGIADYASGGSALVASDGEFGLSAITRHLPIANGIDAIRIAPKVFLVILSCASHVAKKSKVTGQESKDLAGRICGIFSPSAGTLVADSVAHKSETVEKTPIKPILTVKGGGSVPSQRGRPRKTPAKPKPVEEDENADVIPTLIRLEERFLRYHYILFLLGILIENYFFQNFLRKIKKGKGNRF